MRRLRVSENDVEGVKMQSAPGNSSERSGLEEVSRVESPTILENRLAVQSRRQATLRSRGPTLRWNVKLNSGFNYIPVINFANETDIVLPSMVCQHCKALKLKNESHGLCLSLIHIYSM